MANEPTAVTNSAFIEGDSNMIQIGKLRTILINSDVRFMIMEVIFFQLILPWVI